MERFQHLEGWRVVVCKECQYAVWPDQVKGHLQGKQHRVAIIEASKAGNDVQQWPGVARLPSEIQMPTYVEEPVPEIPLYTDGWKCQLDDQRCPYICRDIKTIKKHWRSQHGWSVQNTRGGSGREKAQAVKKRFREGAKQVYCQRFFPQGVHSQYFEVRQPDDAPAAQIHARTSEAAWDRAWQRANEYWELMREEANSRIQKGETDEASPWLKRTGWVEYLEDCDRDDLLRSIRQPNANEDDEEGPIEGAIWDAMGRVAEFSQTTVEQSGVMLRLEAVRTEMHQTRYHPLQTYQDPKAIKDRSRPWQQMLMFFVRTQRQHDWKSPPYRFNRRQFAAFESLVAAAEKAAGGGESDGGEEGDEGSESESEVESGPTIHHAASEPSGPEPLNDIERACLRFCIELLNQRIHNREYDMALVCASAVLGVHPTRGGFRDPESYPPVLSAIVKVAHFMVIQQAEQLTQASENGNVFSPCSSPCDFEDSGYESAEDIEHHNHARRKGQRRSSFEWVHKMMNDFMVRGTGSPIQWILDLRTYGLKIHYNTTAVGHVNWKDKYVLEYKTLRFSMDQFRGMVHDLMTATRKALLEDVLFASSRDEVPQVPWNALHDDPTNGEVGWNFIHDQRSRLPVDGRDWIHRRLQDHPTQRDPFVRKDAAGGIDRERMRDYMRKVARFRGLLLILMHVAGGQPARGTEILSVRHRNTVQGGHRNLFIEDGTVVFVTKYHKGYQMSGDIKIIHRYLPREVGELVVWYLWLALPFIQRMEAMVWEKRAMSDHLWPADADGRKWTTDRMKEELQRVSAAALGKPMHMAAYREIAIAMSRQWVRGATQFQLDEADENEEWRKENILSDVADDQATHSPHIAGMIYARDSMEMSGATADKRGRFRAVSTDWHRFLGFESTRVKDEKTNLKRKRCAFEDDADDERVERRVRLRQMDATRELQWMMRKEVTFRSVQGEAMEAIQRGESPIVAVMPTGAGKSVLFMLPAFVESGGVTVLVVPLRALRRDMIHRCEKIGIRCAVWDGRAQPDGASIVLVTPEKATSEEFGTFINRIRQTKRLDRIVIDEGHVVLNKQLGFRKHLQELGKLGSAETQMVMLTATLPPSSEETLFERMYWRRDEVRLIRASTVRPNIQYSVIDGGKTKAEQHSQLEVIVEEVLSDAHHPSGKVVVMCESKTKVKQIVEAGLFPCEMFHADLSEEAKEETLNDFRDGNVRAIVATGAFGMGIDIPDIRLIVHVDHPRNMLDYGQASGRAGRDGLPSRAIIIRGGIDFEDELVGRYVNTGGRQCRRVEIDGYLDGDMERERCQGGEYHCDVCEGSVQRTQAPEVTEAPGMSRAIEVTQAPGPNTAIGETQAPEKDRITQAPGTGRVAQAPGTGRVAQAPGAGHQTSEVTQVPASVAQEQAQIRREVEMQDQQRRIPEARRVEQVRSAALTQQEIQQRLERWKNVCVMCHQAGRPSCHSISRCSQPGSRPAEMERQKVQRAIRFGSNAGCFKCGVPRVICERWTADGQHRKEGTACQFYGIVIGVVYGVKYGYPGVWSGWVDRMRRQGKAVGNVEEIETFFGRPANEGGLESNEMVRAFMWMTRKIEDGQ